MQYYVFYLRKNEQREAEERTCVYTEIKRDEMMMKIESFGIDRGWARREMTDWGREMETERERNTTPRSTSITPTSLEENTG